MNKLGYQFLTGLVILITVISCNIDEVNSKYQPIRNSKWHRDSTAIFQFPVTDTLQYHDLYINVRNDISYKYSNLWLFVKIFQPGDSTAVADTLEVTLADESGKWLGHGFGGVKTNEALFRHNVYFPLSGSYTIQIEQGMRDRVLDGITDIGYRLEKK